MNVGDRPPTSPGGVTTAAPDAATPDGSNGAPAPAETPAAADKARKSLWTTILTSTPILLTVVATLFAGMSSSEMTRAMYHRSIAAQEESKGGNQFAFFQAKRIRGTNLEMTIVDLEARPERKRVRLAEVAGILKKQAGEYRRIEKDAAAVAAVFALPKPKRPEDAIRIDAAVGLIGGPPLPAIADVVEESSPAHQLKVACYETVLVATGLAPVRDDAVALRDLAHKKVEETEAALRKLEADLDRPVKDEESGVDSSAFAEVPGEDGKSTVQPPDRNRDLFRYTDTRALPVIKEEEGIVSTDKEGKKRQETNPAQSIAPALDDINPVIRLALKAVEERKEDREIHNLLQGRGPDGHPVKGPDGQPLKDKKGHKVGAVTHEQVEQSLDVAERRAVAFDKLDGLVNRFARGFETIGDAQERRGADVAAAADKLKESFAAADIAPLPKEASPMPRADGGTLGAYHLNRARSDADALAARCNRLKADSHEIAVGIKRTSLDFDARRYRQEAAYNLNVAVLRDQQARLSAATSDNHHKKSAYFFYGMLAAQGGVTVATFALAVRLKGILWSLATAAGLVSVSIGAFVFLTI
jgi:hypothetical protein